jgi:hypothetical protein
VHIPDRLALGRLALGSLVAVAVGVPAAFAAQTSSVDLPVGPGVSHRFGLFAEHDRATEADLSAGAASLVPLPPAVATSFSDAAEAGYGPDPSGAVYESPSGSPHFWVVPGSGEACVVWETVKVWPAAHASCGPSAAVDRHGLWATSRDTGHTLAVFGLAPNGTASVELTSADGSRGTAPVVNNAYGVVDPTGKAQSFKLYSSSGAAQTFALSPS